MRAPWIPDLDDLFIAGPRRRGDHPSLDTDNVGAGIESGLPPLDFYFIFYFLIKDFFHVVCLCFFTIIYTSLVNW